MKLPKEHPTSEPAKPPAVPARESGSAGDKPRFLPSLSRRDWLLAFILVAATLLAYGLAGRMGFIWDDDSYVTENPLLTAPDGLRRIWFSLDSPSQYFPLTYTSFYLERRLWGLHPAGYHLVNLLLHAANALLVWSLLRRLRVPGAWLAAAIFALHPVQVESVAWITERKNVLMGFFFLLALRTWLDFIDYQGRILALPPTPSPRPSGERGGVRGIELEKHQPPHPGPLLPLGRRGRKGWRCQDAPDGQDQHPWRFYVLALLFYALALAAKTTACTLPAALLLILWLEKKPIHWRRLAQVIPFVALGLGMGLLTIWWEHHHQGTQGKSFAMGWMERMLIASRALWFYAGKLLWPANLTFSYPRWTVSASDPRVYGWLLATAGLCVLIWRVRRWAGRSVETAALFFALTLSPVLGFVMLYTFIYSFVADHYQYLACLGPIALAAAGMELGLARVAPEKPFLQPILCAALLAVLGMLTWNQCGMYANDETLWQITLRRNPGSWLAHNNLGLDFFQKGRLKEAMEQYHKALELKPDYAVAQMNIGLALGREGRLDEAIAQYQKALDMKPDYIEARNNLGNTLLQLGRPDEAIAEYQKALAIQPNYAEVHLNLGFAYFQLGRLDDAVAQYQKVLALRPDHARAHNNLGLAYFQLGRMDDALAQYQKALDIRPDFAEAHYNLANGFFQLGQLNAAIAEYQESLALQPNHAIAHLNLGTAFFRQERMDEAIAEFRKAAELKPNLAEAHDNLGMALLKRGKLGEAIAQFQEVVRIKPADPKIRYKLAWLLATTGDASLRNGQQAMELAQQATALTKEKDPVSLETLAAACAEVGRFDDARRHVQAAIELAQAAGQSNFVGRLNSELHRYDERHPLHP